MDKEVKGGLVMMWKGSIKGEVMSLAKNFINLKVMDEVTRGWILIGFYGIPDCDKMREFVGVTEEFG